MIEPSELERISDEMGRCFYTHDMEVKCPAELWMLNTIDSYHLRFVHKEGFFNVFENGTPFDVQFSKDKEMSSHKIQVKQKVVDWYRRFNPDATDYFYHLVVHPTLSITSFLNTFLSVENAYPENGYCRVVTRFYEANGVTLPGAVLDAAIEANKKILQEDKEACEKAARGFKKEEHTKLFFPGEERAKAYCEKLNS